MTSRTSIVSPGAPAASPEDPKTAPGAHADEAWAAMVESLRRTTRKLRGIEAISRALGSEHNLERILQTVMARTTELLDARRATLYLVDEQQGGLWSTTIEGGDVATIHLRPGQGIAGWVAQNGRVVNVKDAHKDKRFDPTFDAQTGFTTTSVLCAPLRDSHGLVMGVIQVLNRAEGYFTPDDVELLEAIAAQAAISIQNSKLYLDVVGKNIDLFDTQMRLKERTSELGLLFSVERAASRATSVGEALQSVLATTLEEFPCDAVGAFLVDRERDRPPQTVWLGEHAAGLSERFHDLGAGPWGRVMSTGETIVFGGREGTADAKETVRALGKPGPAGLLLHTLAVVPIRHHEEPLGCMVLANRRSKPSATGRGTLPDAAARLDTQGFDGEDVRLLGVIASRLALAVTVATQQEERQTAERLATIGQMLSGVVHDMNTPLTLLRGFVKRMAREDDGERRDEYRERADRQVAQIVEMTGELLAFARGDSTLLLRKEFVSRFLLDAVETLREEFEPAGVALELETPFRGAVRMDASKMRRVVHNLARNALEAMTARPSPAGDGPSSQPSHAPPSRPTFRIRSDVDGDRAVLSFCDNGPGIPEAMEGRLFEPFATHGKRNGTGLGLALVHRIVTEHGGTLDVSTRREGPDRGTTFTLTLPVAV